MAALGAHTCDKKAWKSHSPSDSERQTQSGRVSLALGRSIGGKHVPVVAATSVFDCKGSIVRALDPDQTATTLSTSAGIRGLFAPTLHSTSSVTAPAVMGSVGPGAGAFFDTDFSCDASSSELSDSSSGTLSSLSASLAVSVPPSDSSDLRGGGSFASDTLAAAADGLLGTVSGRLDASRRSFGGTEGERDAARCASPPSSPSFSESSAPEESLWDA
mmetsp:Transcript_7418/g.30132  ORF Transcript_7418/g.30132 Transcript_7418/m.30132 type:complete len:217 (+) Transcript_7418:515-1165(+)